MNEKYHQEVLLRIRRKYSKSEEWAIILKEIADLKVELGKNLSYIAELEAVIRVLRAGSTDWEAKYLHEKNRADSVIKQHKVKGEKQPKLQKEITRWRDMYFSLKAQHEKDGHKGTGGGDPRP